jgi:hypothetical protein
MAIYTVLAPTVRDGEAAPDAMRTIFVKEGWCWPGLFIPLIWLLFRKMWLVALAYVIAFVALSVLDARLGGPAVSFAMIAVHLYLLLEGNELRRWTLLRRGYRLVGVVEGRSREEAEIRYFADVEPLVAADAVVPVPPTPPTPPTPPVAPVAPAWRSEPQPPAAPSAEKGDIVGLFPAPQRGA